MDDQKHQEKNSKKRVLSDHKQVGKTFVAPLNQIGGLSEINWTGVLLPELVWLGLINAWFPNEKGPELAVSVAKAASSILTRARKQYFGFVSSSLNLDSEQKSKLIEQLKNTGRLDDFRMATWVLPFLYPECPLRFLFQDDYFEGKDNAAALKYFKPILAKLFDRRGRAATLMQATAIYIAFGQDMIVVKEGLQTFKDFPEITRYPETETSRRLGSEIRATMNIFLEVEKESTSQGWAKYFWNHGLKLEPCET